MTYWTLNGIENSSDIFIVFDAMSPTLTAPAPVVTYHAVLFAGVNPTLVVKVVVSTEKDADLVALDEALDELAKFDERKAKIVELKFFGGLSVEETAEVLQISGVTVMREWQKAKAWLYRELNND